MHGNISRDEHGQILVFFALVLPLLILFTAAAVDMGLIYVTKAKLSKAVDAACLTGIKHFSQGETIANSLAADIFNANFGPSPPTPVFTWTAGSATTPVSLQVTATATVNTFFMKYLPQFTTWTLRDTATATRSNLVMSLVLDRSGSMGPDGGMTALQTAVPNFVADFVNGTDNKQTTGSPLLLPHLLNERTYSPLPLLLPQKPKSDFAFRDPVFEKFFKLTEEEYEYQETKSVSGLIGVQSERFGGDWFFYIGPALSFPVLLGFLSSFKDPHLQIVVAVACSTAMALAFCIYSMPHYAAPVTVAMYVFAAEGLRYLWEQHGDGERAFVIAVCLTVVTVSLTRQTGSAAMNAQFAVPDARKLVIQQLKDEPGKQLVLVSYDLERHYPGNELVHKGADFQTEKILWARSKGQGSDAELCQAYPDRTFWGVTTDDKNVSLRPLDLCK